MSFVLHARLPSDDVTTRLRYEPHSEPVLCGRINGLQRRAADECMNGISDTLSLWF